MQPGKVLTLDSENQERAGNTVPLPAQQSNIPVAQAYTNNHTSASGAIPDASSGNMLMLGIVMAALVGAVAAMIVIPIWVPTLGASFLGDEPKVTWYLTRASALTAFVLIWVSMASGLLISNKMARIWPGAFTAFDLHQFTSLLGLGFAAFHVIILLANPYIRYDIVGLLVPFAGDQYRPLWVTLGQIGIYLTILVTFTFYIRKQIGNRTWHLIHYLSYAAFAATLLHGVFSGTDTGNVWVNWMYWLAGISLLALTAYRVAVESKRAKQASMVS